MPSKRSFFNPTLFKKHLSRFWPLWGIVSLVGAMVPLYMQLSIMQDHRIMLDTSDFRYTLYQLAAYFVPAFTFAYASPCVMAVWGYLYNGRSVGLTCSGWQIYGSPERRRWPSWASSASS